MSNIIFGFNNRIDLSTLTSSATFAGTLPLANIKTPVLAQVARTTTDAAFTLTADMGGLAARSIGVVAIAGHNLSRAATVQVQTYQGATPVDDSGVLSPWPFLAADNPHFDAHSYSAAIVDAERIAAMMPTCIYFLPADSAANKVVISIDDSSNAAGYVQIGRLFIGDTLAPAMGAEYGATAFGHVDFSEIQQTKSRVKYNYRHPVIRTLAVSFEHLSNGEATGALYAAQQTHGLTGEIIIALDRPDYTTISGVKVVDSNWFAKAFLANFTALDLLTNPYFNAHAGAVNAEEVPV